MLRGKTQDIDLVSMLKGIEGHKLDTSFVSALEDKFIKKLTDTDAKTKHVSDTLYQIKNEVSTVKMFVQDTKDTIISSKTATEENSTILSNTQSELEQLKLSFTAEIERRVEELESEFDSKIKGIKVVQPVEQPVKIVSAPGQTEQIELIQSEVEAYKQKMEGIESMVVNIIRTVNIEKIETDIDKLYKRLEDKTSSADHAFTREKVAELDSGMRVLREAMNEISIDEHAGELLMLNKKVDALNSKLNHMYNKEIYELQKSKNTAPIAVDLTKYAGSSEVSQLTDQLIKDRKYYDSLFVEVTTRFEKIEENLGTKASSGDLQSTQGYVLKRLFELQNRGI